MSKNNPDSSKPSPLQAIKLGLVNHKLIAIVFLLLAFGAITYGVRPGVIPNDRRDSARLAQEDGNADAARSWLAANAIRLNTVEAGHGFADMQPLKKIIGDARIVSLGEATHGSREFFQLKHRMLEFLATEKGFTIFSIEANMPEAYRLNDYVLNGNGDPAKLIAGMYFWTWNTEEVLDMVLWMREFNKSGKGRVQFTGFDMQTPNVAADIVSDFVAKNDTEYADTLRKASEVAKAAPQGGGASFGVATTTFPIQAAAGKRIRYSGYIKTENISRGWAGLWWRVDGNSGVLAFDNMQDRGAKGTTDWKRYEIDLPVAADAKNINFGVLHTGDGSAWFDGLAVEVDGVPYADTSVFDLDFESPAPKGFYTGGNGYQVQLDKQIFHSGKQSLRMKYTAPPDAGNFGVATGSFPVKDAAGKRVRFSGYIKTEGVTQGYAGLWWRVDGISGVLAFDNMHDRGVTGTTEWKRYEIELPVAADATNINFGALFPANGTAWFDSLTIELDGVPYPVQDALNLDFESPLLDNAGGVSYASTTPLGFHAGGNGYEVQLDRDVFHTGKQSLRMKYARGSNTGGGFGPGNGGNTGGGERREGGGATDYNRVFNGKDVTSKPRILEKPEPQYPEAARKNQITGTVVLRAVFSSSGQVTNIVAASGLPDGLTEKAIEAAKQIRFVPATKDGHPVSMYMQLEYNFSQPIETKAAVSSWQSVVRHLEESRVAYAKKGATTRDIEWAIQNARVVLQCMQLRANEVSRDQSMAENIKWILDNNPGAKIVLWAHNGHVATGGNFGYDPMGASLRKMFGNQMVVFGFAFNQGGFQAIEMPLPSKRGLRTFNVDPAPEGSLDAMLASAGLQIAAIDLRSLPKEGAVAKWFSEPRATKSIGAGYGEEFVAKFLAKQVTPKIYDALLFVERTTAARPLGKSRAAP
jgi:TonB family protein